MACVGAIYHLDTLMRRLTEGAERKIQVRCPQHCRLSEDEQQLLLLVRTAQQNETSVAQRQAGKLVRAGCVAALCRAATGYGRELQQAGLSVSSPPRLALIREAAP